VLVPLAGSAMDDEASEEAVLVALADSAMDEEAAGAPSAVPAMARAASNEVIASIFLVEARENRGMALREITLNPALVIYRGPRRTA
jgi:hypothetical protein